MYRKFYNIIGNQDGFVLGAAILLSAVLILAGVLSLWTTTTEVQVVRNEGLIVREFYNAEGAAIDALENYNTGTTNWLTDNFMMDDPTLANNTVTSNDSEGQQIATVEARCITIDGIDPDLELGYQLPEQAHIGPPPDGSGYSLKHFEVRRYGITASSADGNSQVQVGAWKAFNKY